MSSEAKTPALRACYGARRALSLAGWLLTAGIGQQGVAGTNTQDFTIDAWQTDDGLPQSSVLSIVQTSDGYLWLATYAGLARFDGIRFTVFDSSNVPGLPGNRIVGLHEDDNGTLWLVTEYHDLAQLTAEGCHVWTRGEGVPATGVAWVGSIATARRHLQGLAELAGGDAGGGRGAGRADAEEPGLWIAAPDGGIYRLRGGRFVCVTQPAGFSPPNRVFGIVADDDGTVWMQQGDRLARLGEDGFRVLKTATGDEMVVKCVCPSRGGGFWVVTSEGLRKFRHGKWEANSWPYPDFDSHFEGAVEDVAGNLWLATYNQGLFCFHGAGNWDHFSAESGLTTSALRSVFCDREGNVWVGTDGGGLLRIKPRLWKMITRREGLGINAVHSISEDQQGRIWFAGGTTKPYWLNRGVVSVAIESPISDPMDGVFSVVPAHDGAMWIGIYRAKVFRYDGQALTCYSATEGMRAGSVRAMMEDRQGALWVGGFSGLCRIHGGQVTYYSRSNGLSAEKVTALAEDSRGALYAGTIGGGLNRLLNGSFVVFTGRDGLADDTIGGLYADSEDTLWIGTRGGGLSRFKQGRFTNYRALGALPARTIGPILEDDQGSLWMASELGILRAARQELNAIAEGKRGSINYVAFDRNDGLATTECGGIQPACLKARDGKVWFGTAKGAAFVDPKALKINLLPPPVVIEEVLVDDKPYLSGKTRSVAMLPDQTARKEEQGGKVDERSGLVSASGSPLDSPGTAVTLQPHQHRVEFHFTSLSLTAPTKARFRYRLEGLDEDWLEVGNARKAYYTQLPAGKYRFRVTACNDAGVWNEDGAALGLLVVPPWWRTWWAEAAGVVLATGLMTWFYERRLARLRRARAVQVEFARRLIESQEAERRRMAKELHDGLGQSLILIKNRAQLGLQHLHPPPPIAEQLTEISNVAGSAIDEVRATAWALHPYELERLGLTQAIAAMAQRAGTTSMTKFLTHLDNLDGLFSPEMQMNFYRILQEGINNVLKHAQATEVILEIKRETGTVQATLLDNGRGFETARAGEFPARGGLGLNGMAERARIIGGELVVRSAPGRGTSVRLVVPLTK